MFRETKFWISDNSGAVKVKCIHVYKKQGCQLGNFVKSVLYRFDTRKSLIKKKKYYSLLISLAKKYKRQNGLFIKFSDTRGLLFSDFNTFLGTKIFGPLSKELKFKISEQEFKTLRRLSSGVV